MKEKNLSGMNVKKYDEVGKSSFYSYIYLIKDAYDNDEYKEMFQEAKDNDYIVNNSYYDETWELKNKVGEKYLLDFNLFKMNDELKHYALHKIVNDNFAPTSVQISVSYIKKELIETNYLSMDKINKYKENIESRGDNEKRPLPDFVDFIAFLPTNEETTAYFIFLSKIKIPYCTKSRELPSYESIIKFDYIIRNYIQNHDFNELLKYYPLLIWWIISSIIPLRPGEVFNLKKEYIFEKDGDYYIHIERVKRVCKRNSFKFERIEDFKIQEDVYNFINDYIGYINKFDNSEYLFSTKNLEETTKLASLNNDIVRMTRGRMMGIYSRFINEVIEKEYHYKCVPLGEKTQDNEIEIVKLGDVRHLAIINMMFLGYSPYEIMIMAGHSSMNTQMNYCNHVETFATAKSHVLHEMVVNNCLGSNIEYSSSQYFLEKRKLGEKFTSLPKVEEGKGRCLNGDSVDKCYSISCVFCPYFVPESNFSDEFYEILDNENKKALDTIKIELSRILLDGIVDIKSANQIGKKLGGLLNQKIVIENYKFLKEEDE